MDENESQPVEETTEETEQESETTSQEQPKAEKPKETPEAKKARLTRQLAKVRKELGESDDEPAPSKTKSGELDLGGIAYLASMMGVKGKDEIALAREYIANGKSILDLPDNKYFKQDLDALREAKTSETAVPSASKRGTASSRDSVDYWLTKPFSEVPKEFRIAVIEAREGKKNSPFG